MIRTAALASAFIFAVGAASAATVDFEELGFGPASQTVFSAGSSYSNGGITFTSTEDFQLVGVGGGGMNEDGFVPNDTPNPNTFGTAFITGDFDNDADLTAKFDSTVRNVTFEIADIDGGNDNIATGVPFGNASAPNDREFFTFIAKLAGVVVETLMIDSSAVSGDAAVESIQLGFMGDIDEIVIIAKTQGGTRNIGWGLDNISYAPVPVPASVLLMLTALGGLTVARRRRG